ncbi:hypothetical protein OPQ81_007071 [Rhizoctonia solani]|nr:hypothetical protein OPQ81_007071 [Rhizoctonia solani]
MASPITPALKSSARSAYRSLFRASGATFSGDDRVLHAFRDKVRTETIAGRQEADPVEYEARVKHAFEVAEVLRKNVVQAVKQGEGENSTWKLRMTSDTELGSNEGVKAPYSRPTRGQPRPKCGEDPNAVAPLPPRSLRHLAGSNSTRSYSTAASSSSSNPNDQPQENEFQETIDYDRIRVQSLRTRLQEVGRRVSASPTGRERTTERPLVEDKLSVLAARMEFLASEMHDKLYPPSSNSAPAHTLVDLLLDHLPISSQGTADLVGPPVQLRQYIRFLQNAAKYATAARVEALSLLPEVRIAIGELVETPSPGTRNPNSVLEKLRAIQWRMLMIKRGIQGIIESRTVHYWEVSSMGSALQNAMRNIGFAQECVEDLETNGPRIEDARALLEEIEKCTKGSFITELRREMERRLEVGVQGKRVEDAMISHGLSPAKSQNIKKIYRQMRQYEEFSPRVSEIVAKAREEDNMRYAKKYRRTPIRSYESLLKTIRTHSHHFAMTLGHLITMHPQNDEKAVLLRQAEQALDFDTDVTNEYSRMTMRKAKNGSWIGCAEIVANRLEVVGEIVHQAVNADRQLERYAWGDSGVWEVDEDKKSLFFDARMELVIIYDAAWRLERRMKQDMEDFRETSVLLCEEVHSVFDIPQSTPRELLQPATVFSLGG